MCGERGGGGGGALALSVVSEAAYYYTDRSLISRPASLSVCLSLSAQGYCACGEGAVEMTDRRNDRKGKKGINE